MKKEVYVCMMCERKIVGFPHELGSLYMWTDDRSVLAHMCAKCAARMSEPKAVETLRRWGDKEW